MLDSMLPKYRPVSLRQHTNRTSGDALGGTDCLHVVRPRYPSYGTDHDISRLPVPDGNSVAPSIPFGCVDAVRTRTHELVNNETF